MTTETVSQDWQLYCDVAHCCSKGKFIWLVLLFYCEPFKFPNISTNRTHPSQLTAGILAPGLLLVWGELGLSRSSQVVQLVSYLSYANSSWLNSAMSLVKLRVLPTPVYFLSLCSHIILSAAYAHVLSTENIRVCHYSTACCKQAVASCKYSASPSCLYNFTHPWPDDS